MVSDKNNLSDLAAAINAQSSKTGISATLTSDNSKIELVNENGDDIVIEGFANTGDAASTVTTKAMTYAGVAETGVGTNLITGANDSARVSGNVRLDSAGAFQVSSADATVSTAGVSISILAKVSDVNISTASGAQNAISVIDAAIAGIDKNRASLGATQNRFENTIANLQNISENVSAARGRIQDTDFAAETANLSKNQILQQAGTAILAQAKQLPQAVLSLLQ